MNLQKKCTAIKYLLCVCLISWGFAVNAETLVGKLVQISGPVLVKQADNKVKIVEQEASIAQGDTIVTDGKTYARIQFLDNSEIILGPKTTFVIEQFYFDKITRENDKAAFNLVRGSMHSVPGQIMQRSKEKFVLKTSLGNIEGATANFIIEYTHTGETVITQIMPTYNSIPVYPQLALNDVGNTITDANFDYGTSAVLLAQLTPKPPTGGGLAPGLYVQVIDGIINLSNKGGSQSFSAGQFGYTASFVQPPVVVPANPGLKFTPPPTFSSNTGQATSTSGKAAAVDCEVR